MLRWKLFSSKWTAVSWLVFISVLFILPGSTIPKNNWYADIYLDKWVHVIFFTVLVFLWRTSYDGWPQVYNYILLILAVLYGVGVEYVQELWVPNRSFDVMDVVADAAGSILGLLIWAWGKKNKPL